MFYLFRHENPTSALQSEQKGLSFAVIKLICLRQPSSILVFCLASSVASAAAVDSSGTSKSYPRYSPSFLVKWCLFVALTNTLLYAVSLIREKRCGLSSGWTLKLIRPHFSRNEWTLITAHASPERCRRQAKYYEKSRGTYWLQ